MIAVPNIVRIRIITASIIVGAFLLSGLSYLLPPPSPVVDPDMYYGRVALMTVVAMLNFGTIALFLMGLGIFTTAFKRAYYLFCTGLSIQTLAGLAFPVAAYFGKEESSYFIMWSEIFLVLGIGIIFAGLVHFAKLLRIRTWLINPWYLAALFFVLSIGLWIAPHGSRDGAPEVIFDIGHGLILIEVLFYLVSALLCYKIMRVASKTYTKSIMWFMIGNIMLVVAAGLLLAHDYVEISHIIPLTLVTLPYIVAGIVSILSGYYFNTIGIIKPSAEAQNEAIIDGIIFISSLASNPAEVDVLLDELRYVTATLPRNQDGTAAMTVEQRDKLKDVYRKLEDYLVTQETLRSFTREDLRQLVLERYGLSV